LSSSARRLALFDLDHTLIPFDSGMAWTQFLVARGVLSPEAEAQYLGYCHQYVAGTLDIRAMHRASMLPLLRHARKDVLNWSREFGQHASSRGPEDMRALVRQHLEAGDLCAIVTATERFIAEPLAQVFGIEHLLATQAEIIGEGAGARWSGEIEGDPCFREYKVTHVTRWLRSLGRSLHEFETSRFYSDSASDLPLLQAVTEPVAVCPDERLRAVAAQSGWLILETR
jgi:HAD superfamily hydrolase (TIGR01490 family)